MDPEKRKNEKKRFFWGGDFLSSQHEYSGLVMIGNCH